ncbi:MAG: phosphogluconate dehydrogenase (NAD(+)-dependent, decarboxylating) [Syntrophorhabdaceae bacterium]
MSKPRRNNKGNDPALKLGYVGLGKMGLNMVERLLKKKYSIVAFDAYEGSVKKAADRGAQPAASLKLLASSLAMPRLIWIMVPHESVDSVLKEILFRLDPGDTIIDGGNSHYKDSIRRAEDLEKMGINFIDAGVSGGPAGALEGACIMVGGRKELFDRYEGLFRDLCVPHGYAYLGTCGAGHFVKMVHNGIEYGMMQAIAEGFAVMKAAGLDLDLARIADLYNHGSVVTSRLVGWLGNAFSEYGEKLEGISGSVAQSGEGLWTIEAAKELKIRIPVIEDAVNFRQHSQENPTYMGQILSALRNQFGKHDVFKK